ncbi:4ff8b6af-cab4-4b6c-a3f7-4bb947ec1090 [Thermothielavioides terrestris]|uniref:4ff8b6af-cab4-4b6c-a3f7-4bb947ec1090 n=1 Tax=Thermothielavioides terrestris TaxID=2587410 RepID=A0A446B7U9_9PEZI|nr:4ff8b6af-cab4-4b6c-a3f7-4bb947ec1090 [Thermothielavioides terrestris]
MPVKQIATEFGHSLPPEAPHNITFHIPGWDTAKALRRGDPDLLSRLASIYPRFGPWSRHPPAPPPLPAPTHSLLLYTHPSIFAATARYATSPHRAPEHRIPPAALLFRVLDIPLTLPLPSEPAGDDAAHHGGAPVRLYAVAYPTDRAPGAVGVWSNLGVGISSRLAAALVPAVERGDVRVVEWEGDGEAVRGLEVGVGEEEGEGKGKGTVPGTGHLPLGEAHGALRRRIAGLVGTRGGQVREGDVFLYPTGMAAVYRLHQALVEVRRGGTVVVLGSVFHNSWHLFKEGVGGMKHFGRCDAESGVMEALVEWLAGERAAGRKVGYVFAEFPSNPILVSVDLRRLREVADKHDVPVVIDETIGSFCNIDVSAVADVIITSITKSFSGYANVMGGSVVLPPSSRHYNAIKSTLAAQFRNEYFHADAARLLANSADYLARSAILNRNALALATFLHKHSQLPTSPITAVLYPPFTNTHSNYLAMMRRGPITDPGATTTTTPAQNNSNDPTPSAPSPAGEPQQQPQPQPQPEFHPGYGCLLAIEFRTLALARAFYNSLSVYQGPHLGAHHTLAFPFNDAIWGADAEAAAYLATYGARAEQVRVSVGLEDEAELLETFEAALAVAGRAMGEDGNEKEGREGR